MRQHFARFHLVHPLGLPTVAMVALAAAIVTAAAGCWEEVHYRPPAREPDAREPSADSDAPPPTNNEPELPPAGDDEVPRPSMDELFGFSDPPTTGETASDDDDLPAAELPPVAEPPDGSAPPDPATSPAQRRDAWTLASDWSLAVAIRAKRLPATRYQSYLDDAADAADALDIPLPPLPGGDAETDTLRDAIADLRTGTGAELADAIARRVDPAAGAAARLAVEAHALLLAYSPADADATLAADGLRAAGVAAQLSPEFWRPLVELVQRRSPFVEVRAAIFTMRLAVARHLAERADQAAQ